MAKLHLWMCLFPMACLAESSFMVCEADPAIAGPLARAAIQATDPLLPYEARMKGFRDLMARYPADLFVNGAFLSNLGGYVLLPLYDRELPRYEALYRENPADPARRYLYAVTWQRRDPAKSAEMLEELIREMPDAPWPHLALAWIRGHAKPVDGERAQAGFARFASLCPETIDAGALRTLASDANDAVKKKLADRLRMQLPGRADWQASQAWPVLWELEFQLTPASGHDVLRARIREDIAHFRASKDGIEAQRLDLIRQAYTLLSDSANRSAIASELMRVAPRSKAAAHAAIEQWEEHNPQPNRSASAAEQMAYRRLAWQAAKPWADRWPNYGPAYKNLYSAMSIDDLSPPELRALVHSVWRFMQANPDYLFGFDDPISEVAQRLATRGVELEIAAAMLERAEVNGRARHESDRAAVLRSLTNDDVRNFEQIRNWLHRRTRAILLFRTGKADGAQADLEMLEKEIASAPANGTPFWRGMVAVAEAALTVEASSIARDALVRMKASLDGESGTGDTPAAARSRASHEASWWGIRARLAQSEGRGVDAAAFYLRAAEATPRDFDPGGRIRYLDQAQQAWLACGGTAEGWSAYRMESGATPSSQWVAQDRKMPEFSLQDSDGRTIRLADLAGKTVFINVWATWCGPCQGELPWVQRLYETVKDRPGLVVLTFNVDDNPGLVEQYMREHKLDFPVVLARTFVNDVMKVEAIPANWIIDPRAMLRFERRAGFDDTFVKDAIDAMARASR